MHIQRRHCLAAALAAASAPALHALPVGARPAHAAGLSAPLIVLDSGHNPDNPGARSLNGHEEVEYNDRFVAELASALRWAGWRVVLTRTPPESLPLAARPALANQLGADLFLSIHHDSALEHYLRRVQTPIGPAWQTIAPIRGYSVFVSGRTGRWEPSLRFAQLIGANLLALGRKPTLHHADPPPGENRPLLDAATGIYRYDNLAVLRHAQVPAVLLELGVIVDEGDEAYVSHPENRRAMVRAVVRAANEYIAQGQMGRSGAGQGGAAR